MTAESVMNAIQMGFSELGVDAKIYNTPPGPNPIWMAVRRSSGSWSVYMELDKDERIMIWPPDDGNHLVGPLLSDPLFFEKCLKLMVPENIRYV